MVSCQSSVVGGQTEDPLAEACCPNCGYSLRGLPENRCPECGNAFDPAEVAGVFQPKWPVLMKWLLLAYFCGVVVALPFLASSLIRFGSMPAPNALVVVNVLPYLSKDAVFLIAGIIALIGLHRRRDWGRKAAIAVFAGAFLGGVLPVPVALAFCGPTFSAAFELSDLLLLWLEQWVEVLRPLLIVVFLTTGLRSRSLARRSDEEPPLLLRARFDPRKDWPLLVAIIFAGMAVLETWGIVEHAFLFRYYRSQGVAHNLAIGLTATIITAAAALCTWCTVLFQWRRPGAVRVLLAINLVTTLATLGTRQFVDYLVFPQPPGPLASWTVRVALQCLAPLWPLLAVLIFTVRELREGDLRMARRATSR